MKKYLALFLSLLMITAVFALSANAADPTISAGSANAAPGETVAIDVSISNNPGINSFSLGFSYDEAKLTLKSVTVSPELGGQFAYAKKAVWLNSADSDYNGTILTLTFDTAANAAGTAEVTVTYEEGDIINYDEEDVSFAVVPGKITFQSAACDHKWDAGKVTKTATCKEEGVKTFTCTVCKTTRTEPIAKNEHKWDSGKVTKAATCKEEGVKTFTCTVCKTTRTEPISKTEHTWDGGKITKEATEETEGVKTYTCSICKETKTEPIPKKVPAQQYLLGDVDGNGKIESADARLALRTSVKLEKDIVEGSAAYLAADVNGDGAVKSDDARTILRISVKLESLDDVKAKYGK